MQNNNLKVVNKINGIYDCQPRMQGQMLHPKLPNQDGNVSLLLLFTNLFTG